MGINQSSKKAFNLKEFLRKVENLIHSFKQNPSEFKKNEIITRIGEIVSLLSFTEEKLLENPMYVCPKCTTPVMLTGNDHPLCGVLFVLKNSDNLNNDNLVAQFICAVERIKHHNFVVNNSFEYINSTILPPPENVTLQGVVEPNNTNNTNNSDEWFII